MWGAGRGFPVLAAAQNPWLADGMKERASLLAAQGPLEHEFRIGTEEYRCPEGFLLLLQADNACSGSDQHCFLKNSAGFLKLSCSQTGHAHPHHSLNSASTLRFIFQSCFGPSNANRCDLNLITFPSKSYRLNIQKFEFFHFWKHHHFLIFRPILEQRRMLHITFNMHLVLSRSAWSPSDFICSHLTREKRFFTEVVSWLPLFYVLPSESSKEQLVCNAYILDGGHLTLKYCSLHSPVY